MAVIISAVEMDGEIVVDVVLEPRSRRSVPAEIDDEGNVVEPEREVVIEDEVRERLVWGSIPVRLDGEPSHTPESYVEMIRNELVARYANHEPTVPSGSRPGKGRYVCARCGEDLTLDDESDRLPPCAACKGGRFRRPAEGRPVEAIEALQL